MAEKAKFKCVTKTFFDGRLYYVGDPMETEKRNATVENCFEKVEGDEDNERKKYLENKYLSQMSKDELQEYAEIFYDMKLADMSNKQMRKIIKKKEEGEQSEDEGSSKGSESEDESEDKSESEEDSEESN